MKDKNSVDLSQEYRFEDFAQQLLDRTAADGTLFLKNWYDVFCDDLMTYNNFCATLRWDQQQLESVLRFYLQTIRELKIIANHYDELDGTYEKAAAILPDESTRATFFIFVEPLNAKDNLHLLSEIIGRVGDDFCGSYVILHAQRLCKLLALHAPKPVIGNECRHLFAALVVYNYAENFEKI